MSESSATEALSPEQPWPGPRSFSTTEEEFFFGRSADTDRLTELVLRSPAVLLYSQSGLGKSSLLAAGLMPQLQEMDHLVVPMRLDYKANAHPIGEQLLRDLVKVIKGANVQSRLPEEGESLWEFVHREDFACLTIDGRRLTPVYILDQFEEVFSLTNQSGESFWIKQMQTELEALLSHVVPAQIHPRLKALRKSGDSPKYDLQRISVKLVVGLREEYLPQMDSWSARLPARRTLPA